MLVIHAKFLFLCDWLCSRNHVVNKKRVLNYCAKFPRSDSEEDKLLAVNVIKQLESYFVGETKDFHVNINAQGTPFQKKVWLELGKIPYGQTRSYGDIAAAIGLPKSVRAVANAIGSNPISIIIPCHRVISASYNLSGYAGGLSAKSYLLGVEKFSEYKLLSD